MMETQRFTFNWYDYVLFTTLLGLSTAIGVYFGFFGNKQSTADEYLKGGKKMKVFPISMSLISSQISGVLFLGLPADTYFCGTTYAWSLLSIFLVGVTMPLIYLPVFYRMQLTSIYEYLEARFNSKIRKISSMLFSIASFLYLPLVIYVPALAFAQTTDVEFHLVAVFVCGVCLFYTTVGGIKAVVWTDTLQLIAMIGGTVAIMSIGVKDVGGFSEVYVKNKESGRLDWDTDLTIFKRDTVWAALIGLSIHAMYSVCLTQGTIQKFLSLPNMRDIKIALIIYLVGEFLMKAACVFIGLTIYAKYHDCDPFSIGKIKKHDQLIPFFTMDIGKNIPGLLGIYISGLFCASLSTLSAVMNSLGGTIYEDFVAPFMPHDITQKKVSNILKLIVFFIGITATCLIFVVEKLGGLLPMVISVTGVIGGALFGVFTIGLLIPFVESKGILSGMISSILLMSCLYIPTQWYRSNGYIKDDYKPLNVEGCIGNYTLHFAQNSNIHPFEPWIIFKTSPFWYVLIGFLIELVVCLPVSWFSNKDSNEVDYDLISPLTRWILLKGNNEKVSNDKTYHSVELVKTTNDLEK